MLSVSPPSAHLRVAVDASPWGIGGLLLADGTPSRWFGDRITDDDLQVFNASRGDPAFNILWEALAILVALRLWRTSQHLGASIEVRSDNLPFLWSLRKGSSKNPHIQIILRELALDESHFLILSTSSLTSLASQTSSLITCHVCTHRHLIKFHTRFRACSAKHRHGGI